MKTSFLIVVILILASCKKEYTCACETKENSSGKVISTSTYPIEAKKKSDAVTKCDTYDGKVQSWTTYCGLK